MEKLANCWYNSRTNNDSNADDDLFVCFLSFFRLLLLVFSGLGAWPVACGRGQKADPSDQTVSGMLRFFIDLWIESSQCITVSAHQPANINRPDANPILTAIHSLVIGQVVFT